MRSHSFHKHHRSISNWSGVPCYSPSCLNVPANPVIGLATRSANLNQKHIPKTILIEKIYCLIGVNMRTKFRLVSVACVIWLFITASFPEEAVNINVSDETVFSRNITTLDGAFQANFSQAFGQNYGAYIAEMRQPPAAWDVSASGTKCYPIGHRLSPPLSSKAFTVDVRIKGLTIINPSNSFQSPCYSHISQKER